MTTKPDPFPKGGKVDRALTWIETTLYALRDRWIAYRATFLYREELQGWPSVRRIAPDVLVMKAPYRGPRRMQKWGGLGPAILTGVALVAVTFDSLPHAPVQSEASNQQLWFSVIVGVIGGFISRPLWRRLLTKTRLRIRLDDKTISWRGPDRKKQRVKWEEIHSFSVIAPHRWADEERRNHQNWMQSHPRENAPKPIFQTASELMLNSGPVGSHWRIVAEFGNDGHGEQANRLMQSIDFVREAAAAERAAREQAAEGARPL